MSVDDEKQLDDEKGYIEYRICVAFLLIEIVAIWCIGGLLLSKLLA